MEELLVLIVCFNNDGGCTQASQAYYKSSPKVQELIITKKKYIEKVAGKKQVASAAFLIGAATGTKGKLKLYKNWTLSINTKNPEVALNYLYDF